jgi:hypothetical protein
MFGELGVRFMVSVSSSGNQDVASNEMGASWLFFDKSVRPSEIWAKCRECHKWNKICEKAEIAEFRPSLRKPRTKRCVYCGKEIVIHRVWAARKGMEKPERIKCQ